VNETKNSKFKKRAASLAVASCLSFAPWVADAAGLGKLTVLSGLGQPLRAELDIGATKDEVAGMTARLAPQDVFKQAGVDFASVLLDLRFAVEKRPNGQSVVKVTSAKPINEPFLDFLVELNWPAGRLVREYTFLLDPPEIAATQSSRPVAEARIVDTVRGGGSGGEFRQTPVKPMPRPAPAPVPKAAEPKQKPDASGGRVVQRGETLRKIAAENQYDGVSLEQMLVGLFQNNPDAFIAKNVNRLKAGAILNMPEKSAVEAISPAEAKKFTWRRQATGELIGKNWRPRLRRWRQRTRQVQGRLLLAKLRPKSKRKLHRPNRLRIRSRLHGPTAGARVGLQARRPKWPTRLPRTRRSRMRRIACYPWKRTLTNCRSCWS
jgi:pilus assembly protein FimV